MLLKSKKQVIFCQTDGRKTILGNIEYTCIDTVE